MTSAPILIAFGANVDPLTNLAQGLKKLHQRLGLAAVSKVYRTRAVGLANQPDFFNGAVLSLQESDPHQLKRLLRQIEQEQNRQRNGHPCAPRTLDLDIALMGDLVLNTCSLRLPDPDILRRPFLAIPLAELAPDLIHPQQGIPLETIASGFHLNPGEMEEMAEATQLLQSIPRTERAAPR